MQGCRRSARLLKRAAGLPETVTRAIHHHPDAADTAGPSKRRRRKALVAGSSENNPAQQQQDKPKKAGTLQQEDVQDRGAGSTDQQLPVLGSITNRSDVQQTFDTAAAAAAAAPPAKRGRGRPPRAAAPTAAAAAAEASTDPALPSTARSAGDDSVGPTTAAPPSPAGKTSSRQKPGNSSSSKAASSGPTRAAEQRLWAQGYQAVVGVDEAGRGPLAGPVVAAAAVLPPGAEFALLNDSKQMTEQQRETVYEQLTSHPDVSYAVAVVDEGTIDRINILQAALLAMRTAVEGLAGAGLKPDYVLIDGNKKPPGMDDTPVQTIVKGDTSVTCIAAASVLAKVARDRMMQQLEQPYPQYGFGQHKGYGVPAHRAAIQQHGPCPVHRRSFEPVRSLTKWPGYPKPPGPAAGTVVAARRGGASEAAAGAVGK